MKKKEGTNRVISDRVKYYRVLSIILLAISGVIAFASLIMLAVGGKGKLYLVSAGAVAVIGFSLGEPGFLRKNWDLFVRSMRRIRVTILLVILCDVLLIASIVGMFFFMSGILESRAELFTAGGDLTTVIETGDQALAEETVAGLRNLLGLLITTWLLLILMSILLYTFFKGLAWFLTSGLLPTWKDLYNFLFVNLFWLPVCVVGAILIAIAVKPEVAAVILVAYTGLFLHMTSILTGVFVQKRKVVETYRSAFRIGFSKFRYFLIPYLLVVLSVFIVVQASGLFRWVPAEVMAAIMLITVLPFILAIGRVYLSEVIKELS